MDWRLYCIIDNKQDKDITEDILNISKDTSSSRYSITFEDSPIEFQYSLDRITFLDNPNNLDISDDLVFIRGKLQPEIIEIIQFDSWCKIKYFDEKKTFKQIAEIEGVGWQRIQKSIDLALSYLRAKNYF